MGPASESSTKVARSAGPCTGSVVGGAADPEEEPAGPRGKSGIRVTVHRAQVRLLDRADLQLHSGDQRGERRRAQPGRRQQHHAELGHHHGGEDRVPDMGEHPGRDQVGSLRLAVSTGRGYLNIPLSAVVSWRPDLPVRQEWGMHFSNMLSDGPEDDD